MKSGMFEDRFLGLRLCLLWYLRKIVNSYKLSVLVCPTSINMEILCFVAGMLFFYKQNIYVYLLLIACLLFRPKITIILAFICALLWGWLHSDLVNSKIFADNLDGKTLSLYGKVVSIPKVTSTKTQFILRVKTGPEILVNCYQHCADVQINAYVKAKIKLRKPRNYLNPGGFDYVGFLQARHISWLGSCNTVTILNRHVSAKSFVSFIRNKLKVHLESVNINSQTLAIIQALTIGITNNLTESDWKLFRRTGTIHLLVISGAHIGFVAGFVFFLANYLWSRVPRLCLALPSVNFASICAILAAFSYSLLAGFSVSVQRAFIGCLLVFAKNFLQMKFTSWQIWRFALLACVIYEPHYVLFPGFFLSFIAVAILFIVSRYYKGNKFLTTIVLQLACLIGLLPFTLYWFSYASINGFFANLIAIPLVGFVIVPLALLFLICSLWLNSLWFNNLLTYLIDFLYWYLNYLDKNFNFNVESYLAIYTALSLILMFLLGFLYPIKSLRLSFFSLLCIFILPKANKLQVNEARVDVLDVGQGLAVLIRTANHTLLYDTGGQFYRGKDLGELVISPYLKTLNIKSLDMLVISHPDLDHRGGLPTVEKDFSVKKLVVNSPKYYKRGANCHTFSKWNWDGVTFKFLYITQKFRKKNNDSCVLFLQSKNAKILLTGDIERDAEQYLVMKYSKYLTADYLVVPHHGSKTSSSYEFLQAVKPKYAIFSYGYNNKYHFPDAEVVARYNNLEIKIFNTALQGMITIY